MENASLDIHMEQGGKENQCKVIINFVKITA